MRTPVLLLLLAVAGLALAAALLPSPRSSSAVSGATDVAAGQGHTCAVLKGGQVKCWGLNDSGQLGDGTTTNRTTPTDICADATCASPLTGVVAVDAGVSHTCALTMGGEVKCWGWNEFGQLGDGTSGDGNPATLDNFSSTPVDVCADSPCASSLTGATAVAGGFGHGCALVTGGEVKCWGLNFFGQLGDGATTDSNTPVDVCADSLCASPLTGAD